MRPNSTAARAEFGSSTDTTGANEALLELRQLSKDYASGSGTVCALRDISLSIKRGEFVAIVGTSGSGKSTLMNIIGCLDRPSRGTYRLAGLDVSERSNDARAIVRNRLIGFIFQGFNLLSRTTALENCELPLQYRGVRRQQRRQLATEALRAVGLASRLHHTPAQLSGGQQQRVAIARALVTDPPLLLADEPTGNLDTRTSFEVLALLQKLNQERKITIVLVTHERDIAACASRVLTMRDGLVVDDSANLAPIDASAALESIKDPSTFIEQFAPAASTPLGVEQSGRFGSPLPLSLYAMMFFGTITGAVIAAIYNKAILASETPWTFAFAIPVAEAVLVARRSKSLLRSRLTSDQCSRLALWYTAGGAIALTPILIWIAIPRFDAQTIALLSPTTSLQFALSWLAFIAAMCAAALVRFSLLWLFSRRR